MEDPRFIADYARREARQRIALAMSVVMYVCWPEIREFIELGPVNDTEFQQDICTHALSNGRIRRKRGEVIVCSPASTIGDSPFESSITFRNRQISGF